MAKKTEAEKPKRTMLTASERVAKLEADLAAAKARVEGKDRKRHAVLTENKLALVAKNNELLAKLDDIVAELDEIESRIVIDAVTEALVPEDSEA